VLVAVVVAPGPGEAASTWENVAAFAGAGVAAAAEEAVARQVPVELVGGVELQSHPVAVAEFLPAVAVAAAAAAAVVVAAAVEAVADLAAGAADVAVALRRRGSGFRHGPFVERVDPVEWVCGEPSIAREVVVFPSFPFFVAQRCWLVHPN